VAAHSARAAAGDRISRDDLTRSLCQPFAGSSSRLGFISTFNEVTPVTLLPGRLRPETTPAASGSPPISKTIGIAVVAAFAASAAAVLPAVTIAEGRRLTSSDANSGSRSNWLSAHRYSFTPDEEAALIM
jgi:hypothetical protein